MDNNYLYHAISTEHSEEFYNSTGGGGGGGGGGGMSPDTWAAIGLGVLGVVAPLIGKKKKNDPTYTPPPPPPPKKNNTALYVVGGLAVVGIGVAIVLITRKK